MNYSKGFSLVELSIVLVILGLLVGGVLSGQSLIKAAGLRAISSEYQRYLAAAYSFRDKYFAIPGDMTNATSFWGKDNANCAAAAGAVATPGTCNGDGDGLLPLFGAEEHRFWQQLALAGLIEGTYTGVQGPAGANDVILGTNAPRSKFENSGWAMAQQVGTGGTLSMYNMDYGNYFIFGGQITGSQPKGIILKPEEAWNVDTKLDDGKPATGKVVARGWNNTCAAADDGSSADNDFVASYRISDTTLQCVLMFPKFI
jgi:prepilin-type N-terminal cleavage/methylation domain-containing protein